MPLHSLPPVVAVVAPTNVVVNGGAPVVFSVVLAVVVGSGVVVAKVVTTVVGEVDATVVSSDTWACVVKGSSPLPSSVILSVDAVEGGSALEQTKLYALSHLASFQMGSPGCDECPTRMQNSLFLKLLG